MHSLLFILVKPDQNFINEVVIYSMLRSQASTVVKEAEEGDMSKSCSGDIPHPVATAVFSACY